MHIAFIQRSSRLIEFGYQLGIGMDVTNNWEEFLFVGTVTIDKNSISTSCGDNFFMVISLLLFFLAI